MNLSKQKLSVSHCQKSELSDLLACELEEFYGLSVIKDIEEREKVYVLYRSFLGIFYKKLYVSFLSDRVIGYNIHIFFLGVCICQF